MKILYTIMFLILILSGGCSNKINIKAIQDDPRQYVNKEVSVEGNVTNTFSLAFINYFEMDDGTGKIKVITKNPLPTEKQHIIVKGTVEYYTLGTMSLLVIKEDDSD